MASRDGTLGMLPANFIQEVNVHDETLISRLMNEVCKCVVLSQRECCEVEIWHAVGREFWHAMRKEFWHAMGIILVCRRSRILASSQRVVIQPHKDRN